MPRRSAATREVAPPPQILEHQAAADSQIEDDESWRDQSIPDFSEPPKTRDQVLADLDARDEQLNGHGVRPSEMCGTVAGGGPYPGSRCTFRKHEHDTPHSWETQPPASSVATLTDELPAGQSTLPGTPEPETDDTACPTETQFGGKDFVSAPGLKALGERLIGAHEELAVLEGVEIRYLWKRRGGSSGGNPKLGALQRPGGLLRYFTGGVTFICWLAADNIRALQLDAAKVEACLFHQLSHAELDPEDNDAWRIRGHSFEGFVEELDHYGPWSADLREVAAHIRLLPLDQLLAESEGDGEAEEGEESE